MTNRKHLLLSILLTFASLTLINTVQASDATRIVLQTSAGAIEIEVYEDRAPLSAGDFLTYVDQGLFDGGGFYRVVRKDNDNGSPIIEVIQGGLLDHSHGLGPIALETTEMTGIKHTDGAISLGRTEPDTGSAAAFFICIGDQPSLDFGGMRNKDGQGFAAFGKVINGMDVVRKIQQLRSAAPSEDAYTAGQLLADPVLIQSATRVK